MEGDGSGIEFFEEGSESHELDAVTDSLFCEYGDMFFMECGRGEVIDDVDVGYVRIFCEFGLHGSEFSSLVVERESVFPFFFFE